MLSLRANTMRPLPSLLNESQGSVGSETDRTSMISEMGHLERLSSAAFSTGSSRMSGGYASNTLTPELSLGSQMGNAVAGAALETKVTVHAATCSLACAQAKYPCTNLQGCSHEGLKCQQLHFAQQASWCEQ